MTVELEEFVLSDTVDSHTYDRPQQGTPRTSIATPSLFDNAVLITYVFQQVHTAFCYALVAEPYAIFACSNDYLTPMGRCLPFRKY